MRQTRTKRFCALFLCVSMLIGCAVPAFAADNAETGEANSQLVSVSESLSFITYEEYLSKYPAVEESRATVSFTVPAAEYDKDKTTATAEVKDYQGERCLDTGSEGSVTWNFNVPESGFYTISIRYCPTSELSSGIERVFYINGKVPFKETRHVELIKTWKNTYAGDVFGERDGLFVKDGGGNELRPESAVSYSWTDFVIKDANGFYTAPFEYYFEKGENSITLQSIRDTAAISSFTFAPYEPLKSYADVVSEYGSKGYTEADSAPVYINAEAPDSVSNYTIYPISDHASAITEPQHASLTVLNTIGRDKWSKNGQWIKYKINIEKSGLYVIAPRFKQSMQNGIFVSRELKIDGKVPFEEASSIRFNFGKDWQLAPLSDDDGTPFEFYLEAGEHTIEFQACLGDMSKILQQANRIVESLNNDGIEITKLTGQAPDENRDYGFSRIMPETVADLSYQSQNLKAIVRMISATSGIKSDNTATLSTLAELLRKMGSDESKIAANLDELAEQLSSLGDWVSSMSLQYLEFDYILIQPSSAELPKAKEGFIKSFGYEMRKFLASFVTDYSAMASEDGSGYDGELMAWTSSGREQMLIINNLVKDGYAKEKNVNVTLKLTAMNTLLPAILAGIAPDVSIDSQPPIDLAIRGAIEPLDDFDTFDEVMSRFSESAIVPLRLYGETYAVPTVQKFAMMFYRTDILADLGMEPPKTWDELMSMVPVLKFNNMDVGITGEFAMFIYQGGGSFWNDEGMRTGLDNPESLDALETMINFFVQYSLPLAFNAINRMKTGEMPLFISEYSTYNTLVVSAPEIAGLWTIAEVPGFVRTNEKGEEFIDNRVASTSSGILMPTSVRDKELAWDFMDWFSDKDYQVDYSNSMVALLGSSAKQPVANREAFDELPWTAYEKSVLYSAIDKSVAVEVYPGDYMVMRYLNFVYNRAYSDKVDVSDTMQEYAAAINEELSRKRKEFKLMVAEDWGAVKEYTGFETYTQFREYAAENNISDYEDWMGDVGISRDNYEEWTEQVSSGETALDYKSWVAEN